MLTGHGDDSYLYQTKITADFSTNVFSDGEPAGLKDYLFDRWKEINRYPEAISESLSRKIAGYWNLNSDNILVANGTTESIYLIAQAFSGGMTTIVIPTYCEYEDACKNSGHHIDFLDWKDLRADMAIGSDLMYICNPNNPTGTYFGDLERLIIQNPETVFVVDEAFTEFTTEGKSLISIVKKHENLLVMKSMTKFYTIPGLRLGYVVGSKWHLERLKKFKMPWSVNTLALNAGHFIFDRVANDYSPIKHLLKEKEALFKNLKELDFIEVHPSSTHFLLCETLKGTSAALKKFLIDNYGILIRDASNFRGLGKGHFRVATLDAKKNQLLIKAISEWIRNI